MLTEPLVSIPDLHSTSDTGRSSLGASTPSWFTVRVRPRAEKIAAAALHAKGYHEFLPLYRKRSEWTDRIKQVELPLFPGYVFCRADLAARPPVILTPSVVGLLRFNGTLALIADEEIEAIRRVIHSGLSVEPCPYVREGERVLVQSGALAGTEGILVRTKRGSRVVLSVEALGRSVAVEVDRDCMATPLKRRPVAASFRVGPDCQPLHSSVFPKISVRRSVALTT